MDKTEKNDAAKTKEAKAANACVYVHCPPLQTSSKDFAGMTVGEVRKILAESTDKYPDLEIPEGSTTAVSKDGGKKYEAVSDSHLLSLGEHVEFGRGSSKKG